MNNLNRYNIANIQAQQTLGGDALVVDQNGLLVMYSDYKLLEDKLESFTRVKPEHITELDVAHDPSWTVGCFRFHRNNERNKIKELEAKVAELEEQSKRHSFCYTEICKCFMAERLENEGLKEQINKLKNDTRI